MKRKKPASAAARQAAYRERLAAAGATQILVTVPLDQVQRVRKYCARLLRSIQPPPR